MLYAKHKPSWKNKKVFTKRDRDKRYNIFIENYDKGVQHWSFVPLSSAFAKANRLDQKDLKEKFGASLDEKVDEFVLSNAEKVAQLVRIKEKDISAEARKTFEMSQKNQEKVFQFKRSDRADQFFCNGKQVVFYASKLKEIDGVTSTGQALSTIWDDLLSNNLHKEGNVTFPNGKKPEALIKRCIEICTDEGDLVLDSFAGSGTTAATAHKLRRKWITIELGEHAITHVQPRLKSVVEGTDPSGITKQVNWNGGGGFRFCNLAPSLLKKDNRGNWVISPKYNAVMLAEAVCKHEGFKFWPDQQLYWKQGNSSEKDFIFVTTEFLTSESLDRLASQLKPDESLLICAKAFKVAKNKYDNITIKKIPQMLLGRCEFGRDDYSLNVKEQIQSEMEFDEAELT